MAMQPNKGTQSGSSAAAKRLAEQKASRMGKRTDRNKLAGMGMTKSGVEQRANDAFLRNVAENIYGGDVQIRDQRMDPYDTEGFVTDVSASGNTSYRKPRNKLYSESLGMANKIRGRYGISPKNMTGQQSSMFHEGKSPKYRTFTDSTPRIGRN